MINRSPTKALSGKTPFEAWFGKKPNVKHLRVFGCAAYPHVPRNERGKLYPKAKCCIFLGYATQRKGYRLYDTKTSCIILSRNVVFNESSRGVDSKQEETQSGQIEINEPEGEPEPEGELELGGEPEPERRADQLADPEPVALRRSTRETRHPDYYGVRVYAAEAQEPENVQEALSSSEKEHWKAAMQSEMESMKSNDVWDLVELPKDRKPVGCRWVFKQKMDAYDRIEWYKARLVAQGFSQRKGLDYDEPFSPVIRFESVHTLSSERS